MELKNKIVCFLGDSITEGVGVEDCENCRYDRRILKNEQLKAAYNYGISGTRIEHQSKPSERPRHDLCFCGRAYDLNPDADIIVVYGGVNDYIHGDAPFGTMDDKTPKSFCGGVDFLMTTLKENYPKATVVFMTPAHCFWNGQTDDHPSNHAYKTDPRPLSEYVDVIKKKGQKYNIPVLDLYNTLPVNACNVEDRERYTADGLHFNDDGHKILADCLTKFLKSL